VILFDLSRLLSRAGRQATGIDRIELAYAEHIGAGAGDCRFAVMTAIGRMGILPDRAAESFLSVVKSVWRAPRLSAERQARRLARQLHLRAVCSGERALYAGLPFADGERPAYLLVSHHHLDRFAALHRMKIRTRARFVCLIHDLIPIQYPEYVGPGEAVRHRRRIDTAARLADAIIVGSTEVSDALQPFLEAANRRVPVLVAPFGVDLLVPPPSPPPSVGARPYFVCVGTIEARKNHLLLLNLWRRLAEDLGAAAPALVLIGRRGWEAESAIDMLERCPALRRLVIEQNALGDAEMTRLVVGARAVLLPSFAEGFGLPLAEALALGVPVLCSDIEGLRETGGAAPDYLDPMDGPGWRAAILEFAAPQSPRRDAQVARLSAWRAPRWADHFAAADRFIAEAVRRPGE
jgi:glycosyltransferase involved in cell wall biosynthesis